jgi:flagellar biosynthesis component FlhA
LRVADVGEPALDVHGDKGMAHGYRLSVSSGLFDDQPAEPTESQYLAAFNILVVLTCVTVLVAVMGGWPFLLFTLAFALGAVGCWRGAQKAQARESRSSARSAASPGGKTG